MDMQPKNEMDKIKALSIYFLLFPNLMVVSIGSTQPLVSLTMPKTYLITGDHLILDMEVRSEKAYDVDLFFSLHLNPFDQSQAILYLNQNLNFTSQKVPVVYNFRLSDFKIRIFGPETSSLPSIFGEIIIPPGIEGHFSWEVELKDGTRRVAADRLTFFIADTAPLRMDNLLKISNDDHAEPKKLVWIGINLGLCSACHGSLIWIGPSFVLEGPWWPATPWWPGWWIWSILF